MWHIYTMRYYSALKKDKIMLFAAIWMEVGVVIFSKVSQRGKDKYPMILFIYKI